MVVYQNWHILEAVHFLTNNGKLYSELFSIYFSTVCLCQLGPDIYGCVEYDVKLHMCICTVSACLHVNHLVRYKLVCYIKITEYCIRQCFHPIHTIELLIRTHYTGFFGILATLH